MEVMGLKIRVLNRTAGFQVYHGAFWCGERLLILKAEVPSNKKAAKP